MTIKDKIFLTGHNGMVGSSILRLLLGLNFQSIFTKSKSELDLTDQFSVKKFFTETKPDYVILAAAKVGGIGANLTWPVDFLSTNLQIATLPSTSLH